LLVPDNAPAQFPPLKNWSKHPFLAKLDDGFLVILEDVNHAKRVALVPFTDSYGVPVNGDIKRDSIELGCSVIYDNLEAVKIQPGVFPFKQGQRYSVVSRADDSLTVLFNFQTFTQTATVPQTDCLYLSKPDYEKNISSVLAKLTEQAAAHVAAGDYRSAVSLMRNYKGELAEETSAPREAAARQFEANWAIAWAEHLAQVKPMADSIVKDLQSKANVLAASKNYPAALKLLRTYNGTLAAETASQREEMARQVEIDWQLATSEPQQPAGQADQPPAAPPPQPTPPEQSPPPAPAPPAAGSPFKQINSAKTAVESATERINK
jgi:hypothetical protein